MRGVSNKHCLLTFFIFIRLSMYGIVIECGIVIEYGIEIFKYVKYSVFSSNNQLPQGPTLKL